MSLQCMLEDMSTQSIISLLHPCDKDMDMDQWGHALSTNLFGGTLITAPQQHLQLLCHPVQQKRRMTGVPPMHAGRKHVHPVDHLQNLQLLMFFIAILKLSWNSHIGPHGRWLATAHQSWRRCPNLLILLSLAEGWWGLTTHIF